jgi:addiction module RelE/StbE family toxin
MYKDQYHPSVKKDLKKLEPGARNDIKNNWIQEILADPYRCDELSGILKGIRSFHFKIRATSYRVAYTIEENEKLLMYL